MTSFAYRALIALSQTIVIFLIACMGVLILVVHNVLTLPYTAWMLLSVIFGKASEPPPGPGPDNHPGRRAALPRQALDEPVLCFRVDFRIKK